MHMKNFNLSEFKNKKTAFVCSGGVVKAAAWHTGVALALDELGFTFKNNKTSRINPDQASSHSHRDYEISTYVGSSAGAMICIYLAMGHTPHEIIQATLGISKSKLRPITYKDILSLKMPIKKPTKTQFYEPFEGLPFYVRNLLKPLANFSGFFTTTGIVNFLKNHILDISKFDEFDPDVFVVATQLDHSRKVIFGKYHYPNPRHDATAVYYCDIPIADAVGASMSVPPFYSPYPIKNSLTNEVDYYIDGEIRETLSTHVAIDNKSDVIISSWTHTPYHFHDEIGSLINYGLPAICLQSIYLMIQKKIVAGRAKHVMSKDLIDTVNDFLKTEKFSESQRRKLLSILEIKLNHRSGVTLIDIYPKHRDHKVFFSSTFSLNPKVCSIAMKMAYKRTMDVFRNKEEWITT